MSRPYKFEIMINDAMPKQVCIDLEDALTDECFSEIEWGTGPFPNFCAAGYYSLGGGRTEKEEINKLRGIVWGLLGSYIHVGVRAIYLEEGFEPCSEADFESWKKYGEIAERCNCGRLLEDDDEDGWCWRCEQNGHRCSCGELVGSDDSDETKCVGCKVDEAEYRSEER